MEHRIFFTFFFRQTLQLTELLNQREKNTLREGARVLIEELHRVDAFAGVDDQLKVVGHKGSLEGLVPLSMTDMTVNGCLEEIRQSVNQKLLGMN